MCHHTCAGTERAGTLLLTVVSPHCVSKRCPARHLFTPVKSRILITVHIHTHKEAFDTHLQMRYTVCTYICAHGRRWTHARTCHATRHIMHSVSWGNNKQGIYRHSIYTYIIYSVTLLPTHWEKWILCSKVEQVVQLEKKKTQTCLLKFCDLWTNWQK